MKRRQVLSLLPLAGLVVSAPLAAAAQPSTISVPLHLPAAIAPSQPSVDIGKLASELVESSNFNSYHRPELVGSILEVHDRYRRAAAGNNLVVTYAEPVQFETVGGPLWVLEIVIGLGSPDRVDALFTIDNAGRVVAHEKYSGTLAVELRQAAAAAVGAP